MLQWAQQRAKQSDPLREREATGVCLSVCLSIRLEFLSRESLEPVSFWRFWFPKVHYATVACNDCAELSPQTTVFRTIPICHARACLSWISWHLNFPHAGGLTSKLSSIQYFSVFCIFFTLVARYVRFSAVDFLLEWSWVAVVFFVDCNVHVRLTWSDSWLCGWRLDHSYDHSTMLHLTGGWWWRHHNCLDQGTCSNSSWIRKGYSRSTGRGWHLQGIFSLLQVCHSSSHSCIFFIIKSIEQLCCLHLIHL